MPRYLALDADAGGLFVAAAAVRGGQVKLEQTLLHIDETQTLSPATAKALGERLKDLLKQGKMPAAPVLVCVGRDKVILKEIRHPKASPADEPMVVRFQAQKDLTDALDDVVMDYMPLPGETANGDKTSLVVFVRREVLAAARVLCESAGLKLAGVIPRPFAAAAAAARAVALGAAPPPEDGPAAVLSLTDRGGEFTVVRGGLVRYSRTIPAAALANEQSLLAEVRRNLTLYPGQPGGQEIETVYLAEPSGAGGWAGRLRAGLDVPVHPFDPLASAPAAEMIPAPLRGRFVGPVGLLAACESLPINFQAPRQPRAAANPNRGLIAAGIAAGVLLLVGLAAGGYWLVTDAQSQVDEVKAKIKRADDSLAVLEPDRKRLEAVNEFYSREIVWADELYDLSERFPDIQKMRVNEIIGTPIPVPTDKERLKDEVDRKALAPGKTLPPKPVATLRMTLVTEAEIHAQNLTSSFLKESKYYFRTTQTGGGLLSGVAARGGNLQYIIETQLYHRTPDAYTRKLNVIVPKVTPNVAPLAPSPGKGGDDDLPPAGPFEGGSP